MTLKFENLNRILQNEVCPSAICDLDVFDKNLDILDEHFRNAGKLIRIGSKSIRVPKLIERALKKKSVNGILTFHPFEIQFLQKEIGAKDFLQAYPVYSYPEIQALCKASLNDLDSKITVMVDSEEQLQMLEKEAAALNAQLYICIDCDMGFTFFGQFAGALRSPLTESKDIVALAKKIDEYPHLKFRGIMGYESQNASVGDSNFIYRKMKKKSREIVNSKRQLIVEALTNAELVPEIVNGGGSGCYQENLSEKSITEVGLGSALFKSHLFDSIDSMQDFLPSLFMALRIVRRPRANIVTAFSGGYYCSGGSNLSPKIIFPKGIKSIPLEGFGEVQTPMQYNPNKIQLDLGDIIVTRLAKTGEPLERFNEVLCISDNKLINRFPTYRGAGLWLG
jgi:D-serine deaminase-like pyridoxal phosphate-dependent protein